MAGDAIDPSYDDDDFEVSDDDDVEMASAVKPRPEENRGTISKVASTATAPGGKTPGARRPSGSLTADLRSVAAVNASSSPARALVRGSTRGGRAARAKVRVQVLHRRKRSPPPPTNAAVRPRYRATPRRCASAARSRRLWTRGRQGRRRRGEPRAPDADRRAARGDGGFNPQVPVPRSRRSRRSRARGGPRESPRGRREQGAQAPRRAERAAADVKATSTPWGQMAKGAMDVKCVSVEEAESMRREIQTQDAIMRGYQKENESAMATIAAMRREFAVKEGDFTGTIDRLNGEIARLRLETERTPAATGSVPGEATRRRGVAAQDGAAGVWRARARARSRARRGERRRERRRRRWPAPEWTRATSETTREEAASRGAAGGYREEARGSGGGAGETDRVVHREPGARRGQGRQSSQAGGERQRSSTGTGQERAPRAGQVSTRRRRDVARRHPGGAPGEPADVRDVSSAGVASLLGAGGIEPGTDVCRVSRV